MEYIRHILGFFQRPYSIYSRMVVHQQASVCLHQQNGVDLLAVPNQAKTEAALAFIRSEFASAGKGGSCTEGGLRFEARLHHRRSSLGLNAFLLLLATTYVDCGDRRGGITVTATNFVT